MNAILSNRHHVDWYFHILKCFSTVCQFYFITWWGIFRMYDFKIKGIPCLCQIDVVFRVIFIIVANDLIHLSGRIHFPPSNVNWLYSPTISFDKFCFWLKVANPGLSDSRGLKCSGNSSKQKWKSNSFGKPHLVPSFELPERVMLQLKPILTLSSPINPLTTGAAYIRVFILY